MAKNRDQQEVRFSWKRVPFSSMRMSKIRHQYAILPPYCRHPGKSPHQFWPLSDICRLRRLTFCTYKVLYTEKTAVKTAGGTSQDGVLMATMRCARRHAQGDMRGDINFTGAERESDFWLISIVCRWRQIHVRSRQQTCFS